MFQTLVYGGYNATVFIIIIIATAGRNFGPDSLMCFTRTNGRQVFLKIEIENTLFSPVHEGIGQRELLPGGRNKDLDVVHKPADAV